MESGARAPPMIKYSISSLLITLLLTQLCLQAQVHPETGDPLAFTFSIVARDTATGEMAVWVQSHWFAVGTSVSWGKSGIGVVATQSFVNPAYGPNGLKLMALGQSAEEALKFLMTADRGQAYRQVAFLDNKGRVSVHTGEKCISYASHQIGENYSVQANMMLNEEVVPAMSKAFVDNPHLPLAERIMEVMKAAQSAGGDIRGKQSAALLVVGPKQVAEEWKDKRIDLRVDDHQSPIQELERLLRAFRAYEHMNKGDLAIEHNDMEGALREYGAAEKMFPQNLEMKYWKAVALANKGRLEESLSIFKYVFERDNNWRELTRRLPASGLLNLSDTDLQKILVL